MAQIAKERLDQLQDPELSIEQAMTDYKRIGCSDNRINQRLKSIEIRKELTDEWKQRECQIGNDDWERGKFGITVQTVTLEMKRYGQFSSFNIS